ncbi:hypothetical protein [Streptomyces sp. NPDC048606]|uniref:hypothetical protein n=1 Tax=Streptomyces sp. NPDC048606 TaxID=3154726 RepID=UPI003415818B
MNEHEQRLASLLNDLPGRHDAHFWRAFKAGAGMEHIRERMALAVRSAERGDFLPLAGLVLETFDHEDRSEELAGVLSKQLGGDARAGSWIADVVAAARGVTRADRRNPLEALARKW